ncbi:MAG: double zinc ribbon domain-containing protein [Lachnospiraceae bacterium]|nr:double zinc ribbon domain-containing protein [Lachnospiraceae bacterium]
MLIEIRDTLLNLLFPRRCPICDEPVKFGKGLICPPCLTRISYLDSPTCLKCGKKLHNEAEYCQDCAARSHSFDRGMALFEYQSIAGAIYRFKYKGRHEYADFFGSEICGKLGEDILRLKPDCLIPVPIHAKRLRTRGYNQATALAKVISERLNIPLNEKIIRRVRPTKPLKNLNLQERQNNLKKAFKIERNDVKLNTIIIIDDIFTTGSTIDAMSEELRRIGVKKVYFVALSIGKY